MSCTRAAASCPPCRCPVLRFPSPVGSDSRVWGNHRGPCAAGRGDRFVSRETGAVLSQKKKTKTTSSGLFLGKSRSEKRLQQPMVALRFQTLGCCSSAAAAGTGSAFLWPWQPQERGTWLFLGTGELAAASGPHNPRRGSAGSIPTLLQQHQSPRSCCFWGLRALSSGSCAHSPLRAPCAGGVDTPGTKPASPGSWCPCKAPGVAVACPAAKILPAKPQLL